MQALLIMAAIPASEWQARGRGDSSQAVQAWWPECGFLESTEQLDPVVQVAAIPAFSAGRWGAEPGESPEAHGSDNLTDSEAVRACLKQGDKGWLTPPPKVVLWQSHTPPLHWQGRAVSHMPKMPNSVVFAPCFAFKWSYQPCYLMVLFLVCFFESLSHRFLTPR